MLALWSSGAWGVGDFVLLVGARLKDLLNHLYQGSMRV